MLRYVDMTKSQVEELNFSKTVFLLTLSPLEIHGNHLPVGTDIHIANKMKEQFVSELAHRLPDITPVELPDLPLGADTVPRRGSLPIPSRLLELTLFSIGQELSKIGAKYLIIFDNHGGPRHQLALSVASRNLYKKKKLMCLVPFLRTYRQMVEKNPDLLKETGLASDACGGDDDAHAGRNETSLAMVAGIADISSYAAVPPAEPPSLIGLPALLVSVSKWFEKWGSYRLATDLSHLAHSLAWTDDPNTPAYVGRPTDASIDSGQAMMRYHTKITFDMLNEALTGKVVFDRPLLWSLRIARYLH